MLSVPISDQDPPQSLNRRHRIRPPETERRGVEVEAYQHGGRKNGAGRAEHPVGAKRAAVEMGARRRQLQAREHRSWTSKAAMASPTAQPRRVGDRSRSASAWAARAATYTDRLTIRITPISRASSDAPPRWLGRVLQLPIVPREPPDQHRRRSAVHQGAEPEPDQGSRTAGDARCHGTASDNTRRHRCDGDADRTGEVSGAVRSNLHWSYGRRPVFPAHLARSILSCGSQRLRTSGHRRARHRDPSPTPSDPGRPRPCADQSVSPCVRTRESWRTFVEASSALDRS